MPISMEPFASENQFPTHDPWVHGEQRIGIFQIQCRGCGYEASGQAVMPAACPKCGGRHFERMILPGSILANAARK
jgi:hypothetical protein